MNKVLVIGLDGGTWSLLRPWVKAGKLPTLARLMQRGCHGNLESSVPASTFPAWKCYSTGKNPGKLGVYTYVFVDLRERKIGLSSSLTSRGKELWDYLGEAGLTCGIVDMPTTYPPKPVHGFMIASSLVESRHFTYPRDLERELKEKFGYRLAPDNLFMTDKDLAISDCRDVTRQRFQAAPHLISQFKPSFLHVTVFYGDHLQHYYWRYMEQQDPRYGRVIEDFWEFVDGEIKELLEDFCDESTYVMVMSDHGFTSTRGEYNVVPWLAEKGLLSLARSASLIRVLGKLGLSSVGMAALAQKAGLYPLLRRSLPVSLQKRLFDAFPGNDREPAIHSAVDWERSRIIPIGGGLYINTNLVPLDSHEYENLRRGLIEEMKGMADPRTGEKLFTEVYRREDVYTGEYVDLAPDILPVTSQGYIWAANAGSRLWQYDVSWSGTHAREGIFCLAGPDTSKGVEIKGARIYDLMPTILHILGVPLPADLDGRVLTEAFSPGTELARRSPVYQGIEERDRIRQKIRSLKLDGRL